MKYEYDVVVIGGGAAGLTASKTANGFGKKVALIEKKDRLGGECTWTGCIPSKAIIKCASVAWKAKHLDTYGLGSKNSIQLDTQNVMPFVQAVVQEDYQSHTPQKISELGIDVLFGNVQFLDTYRLDLDGRVITFKKAIICTGSHAFVPPIEGLDQIRFLTNGNFFEQQVLPKSIIILGAGAVGSEMASALNRLGVQVTLVEQSDRILPKEDEELVKIIADTMITEGVTIVTGKKVMRAFKQGNDSGLQMQAHDGSMQDIIAEKLFIATGRRPNIDGLNLEQIGVIATEHGIQADCCMKTSVKNIYAAGDVVGPYQFSHMAWYQGMAAARNACIPFINYRVKYDHVAWVTFTAPELAHLGLTEQQAREQFGEIEIFKKSYQELDRAITDRCTNGMAKYIVDKKGTLLGAQIIGSRAGEILNELQFAKVQGIPFYKIGSLVHVYPTYSEMNWHAAKRAYVKHLKSNFFLKLLQWLFMRKNKQ